MILHQTNNHMKEIMMEAFTLMIRKYSPEVVSLGNGHITFQIIFEIPNKMRNLALNRSKKRKP